MSEQSDTVGTIRELLDRLAESERLSKDEREELADEVTEAARSLPRDGVLEALDRAVGKNRKRLRNSVYILTELSDIPEAVERIVAGLENPDPEWRSWLIQIVGQRSFKGCGPALARIIATDPDQFCRDRAIDAAGILRLPECLAPILALAEQEPANWTPLVALERYGTEECRPYLLRYFADGNDKADRVIAAWGLAKLNEPGALSFLVEMLDDPDERGEKFFHPGESLRAAQAICDLYGWPFKWFKEYVATTKERVAGLQRGPASEWSPQNRP